MLDSLTTFKYAKLLLKSLCNVVSHDVYCISSKVEYLAKEHMQLQKFHQRSYVVMASDLGNAIKKLLDRFSYHRHFNTGSIDFFLFSGEQIRHHVFSRFFLFITFLLLVLFGLWCCPTPGTSVF